MFVETQTTNPTEICAHVAQRQAIEATTPIRATPDAPFRTAEYHHDAILTVAEYYRLRCDMIKARTKLMLQAQASLRVRFDGDKEKAAKAFSDACKDLDNPFRPQVAPYVEALEIFDAQQRAYEKEMVRGLKLLPILHWARDVKGLGDLSLANIIGECSGVGRESGEFYSVGDFKSVSAIWKRMGLAVMDGNRQGAPGKDAGKDDWIRHGYSKTRRSVMWNVGNSLILSMGKFRPMYGEDVDANDDYTYLQKVFAKEARRQALMNCPKMVETKKGSGKFVPKLDKSGEIVRIEKSDSGKDSYCAHAANRAKRYTEKRLLRMLYSEWRACMG